MLTEEIKETSAPPELYAAAGRYYIMDRRTPKQDEQQEQAPKTIPSPLPRHKAESGTGCVGYLLLGFAAAAAGAVIAVQYPMEGMELSRSSTFFSALAARLLHCACYLAAAYSLGYFAAGGIVAWLLPVVYGLGAGVSAATAVMSGCWEAAAAHLVYTAVMCCAAARSAEFSSLLLSIVSGRSGSVVTDGAAGRAYTAKFGMYLMIIAAAAILEAAVSVQ